MNSESQMTTSHFNIKPRELWCPKCKKTIVSNRANDVCEDCFGQPLITVIYSGIDGRRLTGVEPLVMPAWTYADDK